MNTYHYVTTGTPPLVLPGDTGPAKTRDGQRVVVTAEYTHPDAHHDAEVLPMYRVRFPDGFECELFPEELTRCAD